MEKMTIHRALSELKLIDAKITKNIAEIVPTGIYQKGKLINGIMKEEDFKENAQSKFDSVRDLIRRKALLKSAIVQANTDNRVDVGGKNMTVADAINEKNVIKFKKELIARLKAMHNNTIANFNRNKESVEKNLQILLEQALGKDNVKTSKDDVEAISKPYMDKNEVLIFDPLKVDEKIKSLEEEVEKFEAEVDAVLSEANAINFIYLNGKADSNNSDDTGEQVDQRDLPF